MVQSLTAGVALETEEEAECTRFFRMDESTLGETSEESDCDNERDDVSNAESFVYEDIGSKREAAWARDRRELEASKLSFMRQKKKQQQVDESVHLLLRRLEQLPCQNLESKFEDEGLEAIRSELVSDSGHVESSSDLEQILSGKQSQRIAAVAQLHRKGLNVAGADVGATEYSDEAVSEAAMSPTTKSARTCVEHPFAKRRMRSSKSKRDANQIPKVQKAVDESLDRHSENIQSPATGTQIAQQRVDQSNFNAMQTLQPCSEAAKSPLEAHKQINLESSFSSPMVDNSAAPMTQAAQGVNSMGSFASFGNERLTEPAFMTPSPQAGRNAHIREQSMVGSDPFSRWRCQGTQGTPTGKRDVSLGPCHVAIGDDWCGWTIQTSGDGELFYYHEGSGTSQWRTPRELLRVLGEWVEVTDESGNAYWANDVLNMSCWTDPRRTANIFQAAYEGDMFFMQLYLNGAGNLNVVDSSGCTALHYACASSTEGMAAFLLEKGARPDMADLTGGRPLHWACRYSHSEAARLLLDARADPDRQDQHGDAPLHLAAGVDCTSAVQWLLNARASCKQRTWKQGVLRTPVEVAVAVGAHAAAGMLRAHEQELVWQVGQTCPPADVGQPPPLPGFGSCSPGNIHQIPGQSDPPGFGEREASVSVDRPTPVITRPRRGPESAELDEEVMSPVKAIARVAKPLLRAVQSIANRILPVDDTRTKCWELGRGTPELESSRIARLVAAIPRGTLEQVIHNDNCFEDPPGFEHDVPFAPARASEHA